MQKCRTGRPKGETMAQQGGYWVDTTTNNSGRTTGWVVSSQDGSDEWVFSSERKAHEFADGRNAQGQRVEPPVRKDFQAEIGVTYKYGPEYCTFADAFVRDGVQYVALQFHDVDTTESFPVDVFKRYFTRLIAKK